MYNKIHSYKCPPLFPLLVQLVLVLLVPQFMDVSVPHAQQYVCLSSWMHMELLHVTAITHLLLPPTLALRA